MRTFSAKDIKTLCRKKARVHCPQYPEECKAPPFTDYQVASTVTSDDLKTYGDCRLRVAEVDMESKMEKQKQTDIETELKKLLSMDAAQRQVYAVANRARELLTDACPRCGQAFIDFTGCSYLQCSRCPCCFCAWCLMDCGADAHRHVANCTKNLAPARDLFASEQLWREGRLRSKREVVTGYLGKLEQRLAACVVQAVRKQLTDLELSDIIVRFEGN